MSSAAGPEGNSEQAAIRKFRTEMSKIGITYSGPDTSSKVRIAWGALGSKNQAKFYENGQGPARLEKYFGQSSPRGHRDEENCSPQPVPTSPCPSQAESTPDDATWACVEGNPSAIKAIAEIPADMVPPHVKSALKNDSGPKLAMPGRAFAPSSGTGGRNQP